MSAGLESVRRAMADYLNEKGVRAITAWPAAPRQEPGVPGRSGQLSELPGGPV